MSFSFGTPGTTGGTGTPAFSFGTGAATTAATPTTTGTPAFSFGTGTPAKTGTPAFSFGTGTTTTSSLFGATPGTTAGTAGTAAGTGGVTKTTTYGQLSEAEKERIAQLQNRMTAQTKLSDDVSHRVTAPIVRVRTRVGRLAETVGAVQATLACDKEAVMQCKTDVGTLLRAAESAARLAERLKANNYTTDYTVETPSPYFWSLLDECEKRMHLYGRHIEDMGRFLSDGGEYRQFTPQMLRDIMQNQYELFMGLAATVAAIHEQVSIRKDAYLRARRRALPREAARVPDPFDKSRRPAIDFFEPTAEQARELALERRAQLSEAQAKQSQQAGATGTAAATVAGGFGGFGAKPTTGTPAAGTSATFGGFSTTPKPATTPFSLGGSTPATGMSFGTTSTTPAAGASSFSFGTQGASTAKPLSFGTPATTTVRASTPATSFGSFGASSAAKPTTLKFGV